MSAPIVSLATEAAKAGKYPGQFNKREAKMLESVKAYVDGNAVASHKIVAAGNLTTVGGAASEVFTVTGLLSTDIVLLQLKTNAANREIRAHIPATNSLTIRFEADPGAGVIVSYSVIRAA
jgi:hypothetical protein